jgi:hypothetical protein
MIRPSSKCSVLAVSAVALLGCASRSTKVTTAGGPQAAPTHTNSAPLAAPTHTTEGPSFATAAELPEAPRRPDGVVVDPSPELPQAVEVGHAEAALVALKPPLPERAARAVVAAFFRAVVAEDLEALADLTTPDASAPNRNRGSAASILDHWRGRMRHFRYRALASEVLYQEADVELYRYDDFETLIVGRPPRPPEMARSDLLLRVPMLVVRAGSDRAFGDEIQFVLRRAGDRFRIRQIMEDFQMP